MDDELQSIKREWYNCIGKHIEINLQRYVLQKNDQDTRNEVEDMIKCTFIRQSIKSSDKLWRLTNFKHTEDTISFNVSYPNLKSAEAKSPETFNVELEITQMIYIKQYNTIKRKTETQRKLIILTKQLNNLKLYSDNIKTK